MLKILCFSESEKGSPQVQVAKRILSANLHIFLSVFTDANFFEIPTSSVLVNPSTRLIYQWGFQTLRRES